MAMEEEMKKASEELKNRETQKNMAVSSQR